MSKIAVVFGLGARTGAPIAAKFAKEGFKVAVVARSIAEGQTPEGYLAIKADLSDAAKVPSIFETVKSKLGVPSVVIYNAYGALNNPESHFLTAISSVEEAEKAYRIDTLTPLAAARAAIDGFEALPTGTPKAFIYTGNAQNAIPMPWAQGLTLGMGKAATAYWIASAALAYADKDFGLYYADQRTPEGGPMGAAISGEAHAEFYWQLAQGNKDIPAIATFVQGKGYVDFAKK